MSSQPTYCPICSERLSQRRAGGRVRPVCENCGYVHYVNPVPGVGVIIEMDGGVLLIQRGGAPHQGEWTLPSGFVEADESAEEAAIREAEEETGLRIRIIEMMGVNSFPEGPPVSGIMIFYRAQPIGGTLRAGDDAMDARIFLPDDIPVLPFRTHREIMSEWLDLHGGQPASRQPSPRPQFIIRRAVPADNEEVFALMATIPHNRYLGDQDWAAIAVRMHEVASVEVFVAETSSITPILIGCAALSVVRGLTEGIGMISDMAVLPTYQRQGVGAELLEAIMRRAGQLNLHAIWVNTQRANDQARAFYAAVGFSQVDILRLKIR